MSRRYGQNGCVELRDGIWRGRYFIDVPGKRARHKVSVTLGARRDLTNREARRKLPQEILKQDINTPSYRITSKLTLRQHEKQWELRYFGSARIVHAGNDALARFGAPDAALG